MEEDLLEAKAELKYIILAKEELQDAELSRRTSFEAGIASLESDHIYYRRFHSSAMDRLRSESNQTINERDRLVQSVRNSEASKAAVLQSSLHDLGDGDLDTQLRELECTSRQPRSCNIHHHFTASFFSSKIKSEYKSLRLHYLPSTTIYLPSILNIFYYSGGRKHPGSRMAKKVPPEYQFGIKGQPNWARNK